MQKKFLDEKENFLRENGKRDMEPDTEPKIRKKVMENPSKNHPSLLPRSKSIYQRKWIVMYIILL